MLLNYIKFIRRASILASLFLTASCTTYTQQNESIRNNIYNQNYQTALDQLDKSTISRDDNNYVLYKMERGMILYLQEKYSDAINEWTAADHKIEELYTTSISKTMASLMVNDSVTDYSGEAHERVLLSIFAALSFFASGDLDNATVMTRKANEVLNVLNSENHGKNIFRRDTFAHYFSGIIWESKQEWDSAIISYSKALETSQIILNEHYESFGKNSSNEMLEEIALALGRVAEFRNRMEKVEVAQNYLKNKKWIPHLEYVKMGEIFVVYESGKSPIKIAKEFPIVTPKSMMKVSFPTYQSLPYASHYAAVSVDQKLTQKTKVMENIGVIAKQALEDRRVIDFVKITARVIAKGATAEALNKNVSPLAGLAANIVGSLTESADTRSWTSLPDTIQILRIPVTANEEHQILISPPHGGSHPYTVHLKPGEKKLLRLRTFD